MLAATTLVTVAATFAAACNATSQVIAFVMRYDCSAGAGDKTETNASVSLAYDIKRYTVTYKFHPVCHQILLPWCSWLSRESNTLKV